MGRKSRWPFAAATTTSRVHDGLPTTCGVRVLASRALHRPGLRRWPRALRAGDGRNPPGVAIGRAAAPRTGMGPTRRHRRRLCARRLGVLADRAASGRCRSRGDGVGRGGRLRARTGRAAGQPCMAGSRLRTVSLFRHRQAAADPLARAPLPRRLRRDGGRPAGGGVHAALPVDREEDVLLMEKLARRLGRLLKKKRLMLVTAESCTGGWAAQAVTAIAGSSDWFDRGYVTYSNAAKRELLKVKSSTLERHGAVSEATAGEMARGALARSRASVSLSITGVAGPAGGSREKPVGTVCFAWARARTVRSETCHFKGNRESVRRQSVVRALQGVIELLDSR